MGYSSRLAQIIIAGLLICAVRGYADRDIVYAARYYAPPSSGRTSHFHLYRINPDGTGKTQLTFGTDDDSNPKWSPDGKWIVFTRDTVTGINTLCLIRANGGPITNLSSGGGIDDDSISWSPDSRFLAVSGGDYEKPTVCLVSVLTHRIVRRFLGVSDFIWFSDSHHAYLQTNSGDKVRDLRTGAEYPVKNTQNGSLKSPIRLGQYVIGYTIDDKSKTYLLRFFDAMGREVKQVKLNFPHSIPNGQDVPYFFYDGDVLLPIPLSRQWLIYALNDHNSSGMNWEFFRLNMADGTMYYLADGQFLAWSPGATNFCTAPRRYTTPYAKRRYPEPEQKNEPKLWRIEAENRMVWFAPLYVRVMGGGLMRQLTPRLSWVTGADWRKGT